MKIDKLGHPINIGDEIAYSGSAGRNSNRLYLGKIKKLTKTGVTMECGSRCIYEKLIIINEQIEFNKEKYPENLI